jgi:hypothetical protein
MQRFLDEQPKDEVRRLAITDLRDGAGVLAGAYAGLQEDSYYGGDFVFGDLSSDNAQDIGTFNSYKDAQRHNLQPTNVSIDIDLVRDLHRDRTRQHSHQRRAGCCNDCPGRQRRDRRRGASPCGPYTYHNLVKLFGGVPLVLKAPGSVSDANSVVRATSDEVYAQILSDLQQAETLISNQTGPTNTATVGGAKALLARAPTWGTTPTPWPRRMR